MLIVERIPSSIICVVFNSEFIIIIHGSFITELLISSHHDVYERERKDIASLSNLTILITTVHEKYEYE